MNSLLVGMLAHCTPEALGHHDSVEPLVGVGMLGGWEIILILVLVLILFGAKKLPELARGLGTGIKEFKKATREVTDELQTAIDTDAPPSAPTRKLPPNPEADTGHTVARSDESSSSETKS